MSELLFNQMISLEKIRKLMPDCDLTDEQLEELRADMYELADMAFDKWLSEKNKL